MKHSIKHDLPPAQAKAVLAHAFASYAERYPKYAPTLDWTNDREATFGFDVRGKTLRGRAAVNASDIAVELDVPFVFAMFKSVAVQRLDEEAQKWINKAKAGEL